MQGRLHNVAATDVVIVIDTIHIIRLVVMYLSSSPVINLDSSSRKSKRGRGIQK